MELTNIINAITIVYFNINLFLMGIHVERYSQFYVSKKERQQLYLEMMCVLFFGTITLLIRMLIQFTKNQKK